MRRILLKKGKPKEVYTSVNTGVLGRLPFVRTGRPDWSIRKWNAPVLRTEWTGSGQTGPAHEGGPLSSLGPARNARSVQWDMWRQVPCFVRGQQTITAICFLCSMGGLPNVYARLELTNKQVAHMSGMLSGNGSWSHCIDSEEPWVRSSPQFSLICTEKKYK